MALDLYIDGFAFCTQPPQPQDFAPWFEARRLRRMETQSAQILLASCQALEMAGQPVAQEKPFALSLGIGPGSLQNTCKFIDSILQDGDELSSPTAFAGSVHNSAGLTLSLFLNLRGPCVTSGQFNTSFGAALLTAQSFLYNAMAPYVLVAVADSVNPVACALREKYPQVLGGAFSAGYPTHAAAAFLISARKTPHAKAKITDFQFSCLQPAYVPSLGDGWAPLAAAPAIQLCSLLKQEKNHFEIKDNSLGVCTVIKGELLNAY